MKRLFDVGAFGIYLGVRIGRNGKLEYSLRRREEIELENDRCSSYLP